MGKKDLIGGSMWNDYSQVVADRMDNPRNLGVLTQEDADRTGTKLIVADYGAESCGDSVRLYWLVNTDHVIVDAKFKSFGCGTAIASSDMMAELCIGKTVDEAVKITNLDVEQALRDNPDTPAVPPQKMHCSVMAYDVIKKAVSLYNGVDMATLESEEIICECARVTVKDLEDAIRINNLKTPEQVADYTKAGAFCKSCVKPGGHEERDLYIVDVIKRVQAGLETQQLENQSFAELSIVKQIKAIEAVLDADIRPVLANDGGGLELLDVNVMEGKATLSVAYQGACRGCASALTGTLQFIENKLEEAIGIPVSVQVN